MIVVDASAALESPLRPAIMRASSWCESKASERAPAPSWAGCSAADIPASKHFSSAIGQRRPFRAAFLRRWLRHLPAAGFHGGDLVLKRSRQRRSANNKSARCALKNATRQEKREKATKRSRGRVSASKKA
jgi:hypothetical protein